MHTGKNIVFYEGETVNIGTSWSFLHVWPFRYNRYGNTFHAERQLPSGDWTVVYQKDLETYHVYSWETCFSGEDMYSLNLSSDCMGEIPGQGHECAEGSYMIVVAVCGEEHILPFTVESK